MRLRRHQPPTLKVTPTGYVETYYGYNFARPSNGITNYRGYDNRHNTFSLTNAALGAGWESGEIAGRVPLAGSITASTEYLAGARTAGNTGGQRDRARSLEVRPRSLRGCKSPSSRPGSAGRSVLGARRVREVLPVKDNWNWSRSNLFLVLWSYQTGARALYDVSDQWSLGLGVYNGWNSVVDNNTYKSIQANIISPFDRQGSRTVSLFWRRGKTEEFARRHAWRNDFNLYAQWDAIDWLLRSRPLQCWLRAQRLRHFLVVRGRGSTRGCILFSWLFAAGARRSLLGAGALQCLGSRVSYFFGVARAGSAS